MMTSQPRACAPETPLIPRSLLFGNPERTLPALSPDGQRLAYLAPVDGVLNLWVGSLDPDDARPVTDDHGRGIQIYMWAHDNRHLLYMQDRDGDENWRLCIVDPDSGLIRQATPFEGVQARIIKVSMQRPDEMLVGLNRDHQALHDVYRLRLSTGELDLVERHPGLDAGLTSWVADEDLQIRASTWIATDGSVELRVRDEPGGPWRLLTAFDPMDSLTSHAFSFSGDGQRLLLRSSQGAPSRRLVWADLATGDTTVVAEDPQYDIAWVMQHPETYEPQVVSFLKERHQYKVLDPSLAEDVRSVRALHHGDFVLVSRDHADRRWIVGFVADDTPATYAPGTYFLYDRTTRRGRLLFQGLPELCAYRLARTEPFSFTARDGLVVNGYLTFPPRAGRTGLPTVLLVHGGPWTRDSWKWMPEVQFLANRGYLVVQVNYRGSTGYGKAFINAGNREWGGKMHDDLVDAVDWAVARGHADRERTAILGGSYGGYAALVGATFTPDVFRCAVAWCGPTNLKTLIETTPRYWIGFNRQLRARVGDPETEADFLWSRSPLSRVDDIRIPVLIAQGGNDPRVKRAESEQIVAAMRKRGIPHEYLVFEEEGHGFLKPESSVAFWAAAERFLARFLGGRCEAEAPVSRRR